MRATTKRGTSGRGTSLRPTPPPGLEREVTRMLTAIDALEQLEDPPDLCVDAEIRDLAKRLRMPYLLLRMVPAIDGDIDRDDLTELITNRAAMEAMARREMSQLGRKAWMCARCFAAVPRKLPNCNRCTPPEPRR